MTKLHNLYLTEQIPGMTLFQNCDFKIKGDNFCKLINFKTNFTIRWNKNLRLCLDNVFSLVSISLFFPHIWSALHYYYYWNDRQLTSALHVYVYIYNIPTSRMPYAKKWRNTCKRYTIKLPCEGNWHNNGVKKTQRRDLDCAKWESRRNTWRRNTQKKLSGEAEVGGTTMGTRKHSGGRHTEITLFYGLQCTHCGGTWNIPR